MPVKNTRTKSKIHSKKTAKKRNIRPKDLYRLIYVGDPQISPDGKKVLFTHKTIGEKHKYLTNLWVVPTGNGTPRPFTNSGKDRLGRWSPDGNTIAFVSDREESQPQIYTISANGGEARQLTSFPEGSIASFDWSPDGSMLAVKYRRTDEEHTKAAAKKREETDEADSPYVIDDFYYRFDGDGYFGPQRFHLDIVDVETGEHRLLYDKDNIGWFKYDWSPDSKELLVAANTEKNAIVKFWKWNLFRLNAKTGKASRIPNIPTSLKLKVLWSPDGKRIAFAGHEGSACWGVENSRIYVCNKDGSDLRDLTGKHDYCFSASTISDSQEMSWEEDFVWSRDGKSLFASVAWQGATQIVSLSSKDGSIETLTRGRKTFMMRNLSADGKSLAMMTGDFLNPTEIALGEISKSGKSHSLKVTPLTHFNRPMLKKLELTPAESSWIRSVDGNRVQVWTMFPPGSPKKKRHPTILTVHGGPHCQYGETFFHELQVYAAAGYAVVFCNPRGSKGYGEEHCTSIRGNWGQADWRDIQAVIEYMKSNSNIDSNKMAVVGGSYGGYMTNWVISHTNDFAAAITDRCVSNLVSMVGTSDLPLVPGEYWHGNSWDNIEELWEQSPLKHFGNVKTPTLVIHSEGDLRCNIEQSEQIFAALKLRGIPTRFVRYPRSTSHGLSRCGPPNLRIHRLKQYLSWLDKYLQ